MLVATVAVLIGIGPVARSSADDHLAGREGTLASGDGTDQPSLSAGDLLFPELGSADLDVQHYDWASSFDPRSGTIDATMTITTALTRNVRAIALDDVDLQVGAVTVDDVPTTFHTEGHKLIVDLPAPAGPLAAEDALEVAVRYRVTTGTTGPASMFDLGWFTTPEGTSFTLNEPDGARSWMPVNDHPSDKATWQFEITVPAGTTAVANGVPRGVRRASVTTTTWSWVQDDLMATYLVGIQTGPYEVITSEGPHGLPLTSAVLRDDLDVMQAYLDVTPEQVAFFEEAFGKYPLSGYGIAITDSLPGLAMETQGRPTFSRDDFSSGSLGGIESLFLTHELAHQWFGDAVTPAQWQDIWLTESFATYGQWMWLEHLGLATVSQSAVAALRGRQHATYPTASPPADRLFSFETYDGGATVLHALRTRVGDDVFFEILRTWVERYNGTSKTTKDFVALAQELSGRDLTALFAAWLYSPSQPATFDG